MKIAKTRKVKTPTRGTEGSAVLTSTFLTIIHLHCASLNQEIDTLFLLASKRMYLKVTLLSL